MSHDDIAVLVASCDEFSDLWPAFFTLFFRYWPHCPYAVYLGSDTRTWPDPRVRSVLVPGCEDKSGWSARVRGMLEQVREPYVILLLEDFLLQAAVDTARIGDLAEYMRRRHAGYLRLYPAPGPDVLCADRDDVGENRAGQRYRICTQASLWEKKLLCDLLRDGESIWQFEGMASKRADQVNRPFLSVTRHRGRAGDTPRIDNAAVPYFCTAVVTGRWLRDAVALCAREGITVDLAARPVEPWAGYFGRVMLPELPGGATLAAVWQACRRISSTAGAAGRRCLRRIAGAFAG